MTVSLSAGESTEQEPSLSLVPSDDVRQLREILERIVTREYTSARVRATIDSDDPYDAQAWRRLTDEFGLVGMALPAEHGGGGADARSLATALEVLGARVAPTPMFGTVALFATTLAESGDVQLCAEVLPQVAAGQLLGACAFAEVGPAWTLRPGTRAERAGDTWQVSGAKTLVIDGSAAHQALVTATAPDGLGVFLVDLSSPGVTRSAQPSSDLTRDLAHVELAAVPARRVTISDVQALLARVRDLAAVHLSAEMLGGLRAAAQLAADYAKIRYQFGRPIGSFQAVKHRVADMYVRVELATAVVRAAANAAADDPAHLPEASAVALSLVSEYARLSGDDLIHVHGGIGFTWEHDAHLYYRRAVSSATLLGSRDSHLDRLADLVIRS